MSKEISDEIKKLAKTIEAKLQVGDDGTVSAPKGLFEDTLPEGVSSEDIKKVSRVYGDFASASALAVGNVAIKAMKENKDLNRVSCSFPLTGHDKIQHSIDRELSGTALGKEWSVKGKLSTKAEIFGACSAKRGGLKAIAELLSEKAAKEL